MPGVVAFHHETLGSVAAGCASTTVGHPLDTIKVHMQQQQNHHHQNKSLTSIARQLGPWRLWAGIGPPLANAMLMNTVMFGAFRVGKEKCGDSALLAGILAGFATACISTPTDWVKIQAQLRPATTASSGNSTISILRYGLQAPRTRLFRGHGVNMAREGVFTMVYLGLYDVLRQESDHNNNHGVAGVALTSAGTGALAWVASYPLDTLKTRVQASHDHHPLQSARQHLRNILVLEKGGWRTLYRGCLPSTGRAILVTSLRMITYDAVTTRLST